MKVFPVRLRKTSGSDPGGSMMEADVTTDLKLALEDKFKCGAAEGAKCSL